MTDSYPQQIAVEAADSGTRLDQLLVGKLPDVSRARVQQLIEQGKILVNGRPGKPSLRLKGSEEILLTGPVALPPVKATPEDIPLEIIYEDADLAVINKPAGMVVHASAGSAEDSRNRGTLVNALLHRFSKLSKVGGELRPGIVHRLDKDTSGLIVVALNDRSHRKLAAQFAARSTEKRYLALVHGWPKQDSGTIDEPVGRDKANRARMSTNSDEGRDAVSHFRVLRKIDSRYGKFALLEVKIDTGRTHQIRVHLASIRHPVVGDTLYGAAGALSPMTRERQRFGNAVSTKVEARKAELKRKKGTEPTTLQLGRNFLHAASLKLRHPKTGEELRFASQLPRELESFLGALQSDNGPASNL